MTTEDGVIGSAWTEDEVEATVAVYFQMLRMQELGQKSNKTEHNPVNWGRRQFALLNCLRPL